jgi:hypothetical protein
MADSESKRCTKCGEEKPLEQFPPLKAVRSGIAPHCRACQRKQNAEWREKNRAHDKARKAKWNKEHPWPLEKNRANGARWRRENPEKNTARHKKYYAENAEKVCARTRANAASQPEKYGALRLRWQRENRPKMREYHHTRVAREKAAGGRGVTAKQWGQVLTDSLGLCAYCNERRPLEMDHIEPFSRGGEHDVDNITAACRSCNSSKCDTGLLIWLARKAANRSGVRWVWLQGAA